MNKLIGTYLGIVAVLIFLPLSVSYSKNLSLFEPDGFFVNRSEGFKMGYIAGFVKAKSDGLSVVLSYTYNLLEKLKKEKLISKNLDESKLIDIQAEILKRYMSEDSYDNIPFGQLLGGIDDFYKDSANMKVILPHVLEIVKLKVKGEKGDYIKCMTEYYRMHASIDLKKKGNMEILKNKAASCIKLRHN
jgi:hypothetical protein